MPEIKIALNIMRIMKNWPVSFAEYFGLYRILKKNHIQYILRNGIKYEIRTETSDRAIFHEIWVRKYYNPKGFIIKEDDLVIDIGAHIGIFAVFAAQFAKNGKIYAFEPMPENFEMLRNNIGINKSTNIISVNKAVSDKKGEKELYLSKDNTGEHSFIFNEDKSKKVKVKTISLKDIIDEYNLTKINFLKIDCEGAEYEILLNSPQDIFHKIEKISMECHYIDKTRNIFSLKKYLEEQGFDVTIRENFPMLYAKNKFISE